MMNYKELIKQAYETACEKGFHVCPECKGHKISCLGAGQCDNSGIDCTPNSNCGEYEPKCKKCNGTGINHNMSNRHFRGMIVTEIGEAIEAFRINKLSNKDHVNYTFAIFNQEGTSGYFKTQFENHVKNTFGDEITDIYIRIFDWAGYLHFDEFEIKPYQFESYDNVVCMLDEVTQNLYKDYRNRYSIELTLSALNELCKHLNIDIEKHIIAKMAYNKTRPYKHGKEF
jgi:hypothetical protein